MWSYHTRLHRQNMLLTYKCIIVRCMRPEGVSLGPTRKKVEVVNYPDGRFVIQHEGMSLPFRVFDKIQTVQPGAIVENKRLGAALAMVKARSGDLRAQSAPSSSGAAAPAEQPRGARNADKGTAVPSGGRRDPMTRRRTASPWCWLSGGLKGRAPRAGSAGFSP